MPPEDPFTRPVPFLSFPPRASAINRRRGNRGRHKRRQPVEQQGTLLGMAEGTAAVARGGFIDSGITPDAALGTANGQSWRASSVRYSVAGQIVEVRVNSTTNITAQSLANLWVVLKSSGSEAARWALAAPTGDVSQTGMTTRTRTYDIREIAFDTGDTIVLELWDGQPPADQK